MFWILPGALVSLVLAQPPVPPAEPPAGSPPASAETTVVAPRVPTPLSRTPAAVSVVEREDIQEGRPTLGVYEALVGVPGLVVQSRNNASQDLRLSLRKLHSLHDILTRNDTKQLQIIFHNRHHFQTIPSHITLIQVIGKANVIKLMEGQTHNLAITNM